MLTFSFFQDIVARRSTKWLGSLDKWSASDWCVALGGEIGEAFNIVKKLNRYRDGVIGNDEKVKELQEKLKKEIADIITYAFAFAASQNINIEEVIIKKFNEVSIRNGLSEFRIGKTASTEIEQIRPDLTEVNWNDSSNTQHDIKPGDWVHHTKPYQDWPKGIIKQVKSVSRWSFRVEGSDENWYAPHFKVIEGHKKEAGND